MNGSDKLRASDLVRHRAYLSYIVETRAKQKFESINAKGYYVLQDTAWVPGREQPTRNATTIEHVTNRARWGQWTTWNNVDHWYSVIRELLQHYDRGKFLQRWTMLLDQYPISVRISNPARSGDFTAKEADNFLRVQLLDLYTLIDLDLQQELQRWDQCVTNGALYSFPLSSSNTDPYVQ